MSDLIQDKEMEAIKKIHELIAENESGEIEENFKPKGAIAFFTLLIILCAVVWYGIYFLMLQRN